MFRRERLNDFRKAQGSRLLFLAEFLESGIGAQLVPDRIEPESRAIALADWSNGQPRANLLINGFRLRFGKEFLKPWIVTNWVPHGVDL